MKGKSGPGKFSYDARAVRTPNTYDIYEKDNVTVLQLWMCIFYIYRIQMTDDGS